MGNVWQRIWDYVDFSPMPFYGYTAKSGLSMYRNASRIDPVVQTDSEYHIWIRNSDTTPYKISLTKSISKPLYHIKHKLRKSTGTTMHHRSGRSFGKFQIHPLLDVGIGQYCHNIPMNQSLFCKRMNQVCPTQ